MHDHRDPALMTSAQVAAYLGVSRRQFDHWVSAGIFDLPPMRLHGAWRRWSRAQVTAWADQRAVAS